MCDFTKCIWSVQTEHYGIVCTINDKPVPDFCEKSCFKTVDDVTDEFFLQALTLREYFLQSEKYEDVCTYKVVSFYPEGDL